MILLIISYILFWMSLGGFDFFHITQSQNNLDGWTADFDMIRYLDDVRNNSLLFDQFVMQSVDDWTTFMLEHHKVFLDKNNQVDYEVIYDAYENISLDQATDFNKWLIEYVKSTSLNWEELEQKIINDMKEADEYILQEKIELAKQAILDM